MKFQGNDTLKLSQGEQDCVLAPARVMSEGAAQCIIKAEASVGDVEYALERLGHCTPEMAAKWTPALLERRDIAAEVAERLRTISDSSAEA